MCKTINTRYLGCGGDHIEIVSKECITAKVNRTKGKWFECTQQGCKHLYDEKCPVCRKTPAKKLARVLKNPVHTVRFFSERNIGIQTMDTEDHMEDVYPRVIKAKKNSYREIPYWQMIQYVKVEIALTTDQDAMSGQETPGEIIGRILR